MALNTSMNKGRELYRQRKNYLNNGESISSEANFFGNLEYLLQVPAKGNIPTNSLTAQQQIDFEIKSTPAYVLKDNFSIFLLVKVTETGGAATITPTWAEGFLDIRAGIQFLMNGKEVGPPLPMMQTVLEPIERLSVQEYTQLVTLMNHGVSLAYNSGSTAVGISSSANYFLRLPNIFPSDEPFWLGAFTGSGSENTLTIRIKTQSGGAINTGSGVLSMQTDGFSLLLDCIQVTEDQQRELAKTWAKRYWRVEEWVLNEPNPAITTVSSGDSPKVKLETFKDLAITRFYMFFHASRAITANAYFNFVAPANTATFQVQDKSGTQLFTSNKEFVAWNKAIKTIRQYTDSPVVNANILLINAAPDLVAKRVNNSAEGQYIFTGDETFTISDFGSAAALYPDAIGVVERVYCIEDGKIRKENL